MILLQTQFAECLLDKTTPSSKIEFFLAGGKF